MSNDPHNPADAGTSRTSHELSSGIVVELPLATDALMYGAVFGAERDGVAALLPDGLRPIAVTPTRSAVAFVSVDYRDIGCPEIEPYDEFLVILPAVAGSDPTVPLVSVLRRRALGYVWYMPVTTEVARELGREIWGYPKVVADISFRDDGDRRRTDVAVDGMDFICLQSTRTPTLDLQLDLAGATVRDGTLLEESLHLQGELGALPFGGSTSFSLGDHPRARRLRELDLGTSALFRFYADTELVIGSGSPLRNR